MSREAELEANISESAAALAAMQRAIDEHSRRAPLQTSAWPCWSLRRRPFQLPSLHFRSSLRIGEFTSIRAQDDKM